MAMRIPAENLNVSFSCFHCRVVCSNHSGRFRVLNRLALLFRPRRLIPCHQRLWRQVCRGRWQRRRPSPHSPCPATFASFSPRPRLSCRHYQSPRILLPNHLPVPRRPTRRRWPRQSRTRHLPAMSATNACRAAHVAPHLSNHRHCPAVTVMSPPCSHSCGRRRDTRICRSSRPRFRAPACRRRSHRPRAHTTRMRSRPRITPLRRMRRPLPSCAARISRPS